MTVNSVPKFRTQLISSAKVASEKIKSGLYEFRYMIRGSNGVVMQRVRKLETSNPMLPKEVFLRWRVEDEVFDVIMSRMPTDGSVGVYLATGAI